MMMLDSTSVRSPSRSTGMRCRGQSDACSARFCSCSASSMQNSNGVEFSYSAISTFWQYDENGWA